MGFVLVVDDKELMRDSVGGTLGRAGFEVRTANDGESALAMIARQRPDAVVTDLKMPGLGGLGLLERVRGLDEDVPVVLMTAFGTVETAVRAMKLGAFDYITKPFEGDELIIAVRRAIQHARLVKDNAVLRARGQPGEGGGPTEAGMGLARIIGASPAMRRVKEQVLAVAESQGTVLVVGESGSGKEVIAKAIHECSQRRSGPMLAVNCAALSESLLESELFGHERGAFTGADRLRKGRFELADGGTLLLDEVSEVGAHVQAKLLRVLQERAFERVGSSVTMGVDVRVVATSNRDLPASVARGAFRQDLFFRLNVLPIHVPPLRDRPEDIGPLADHFVRKICEREGRPEMRLEASAEDLMRGYEWPGNVRELQNICERAVVLSGAGKAADGSEPRGIPRSLIEPWLAPGPIRGGWATGPIVTSAHTDRAISRPAAPEAVSQVVESKMMPGISTDRFFAPIGRTLEEIERDTIVQTLERFNGHRQKTARALGIGVRTLGLKLKKWKQERLVAETV